MSIIKSLAPLGAQHQLALTIAYSEDGAKATVTVMIKPKEGAKNATPRTVQFSGPVEDVDAKIAEELPKVSEAIALHVTGIDDLQKQLAAEKAKAEAEAKENAAKPAAPAKAAKASPGKRTRRKAGESGEAADDSTDDAETESTEEEPTPLAESAPAEDSTSPAEPDGRPRTAAEEAVLGMDIGTDDNPAI